MGDDGNVFVPLPFTFNFYGQNFQNSWMYDNGVVSFLQPGSPYALNPGQWSSQPLDQVSSRYFIAALWADVAPIGSTKYFTTTDGSSYVKYTWENLSEYYSGGSRLNTFNTRIGADGSILTSYTALNLQTSNIAVGTVGDGTKGEVNNIYWAPYGTKLSTGGLQEWSQNGGPATDPCVENPLSSSSCPGYGAALIASLPQTTAPQTTADPVATALTPLAAPITTAPSVPAPVVEAAAPVKTETAVAASTPVTSAAPTALNPQPKIGEVGTAGSSKPQVSMSTIMSAVNAEQSRVQQAEKMVADQVKEISAAVTANAEQTASSASNQSIAIANTSTAISTTAVVNSVAGVPGATLNIGTATSAQQAFGVPEVQQSTAEVFTVALARPQTPIAVEISSSNLEVRSTEDLVLRDLINGAPTIAQVQEVKEKPAVNTKTKDNDAAGSVTIAAIATVPLGYEAYSAFSLKDVPFYPPTQVYKNQKTVDNVRVLRALNARSDAKHDEMVEQQYKGKKNDNGN